MLLLLALLKDNMTIGKQRELGKEDVGQEHQKDAKLTSSAITWYLLVFERVECIFTTFTEIITVPSEKSFN